MMEQPAEDEALTCLYCGEQVGVYEPLIVVEHDGERKTSLAREPELAERRRILLVHGCCAAAGRSP